MIKIFSSPSKTECWQNEALPSKAQVHMQQVH